MMTSGERVGISPRNSRQHIAGFGVFDGCVGDKTGNSARLGGGVQPADFMRRNLQHRRSERFRVLRRVQQREPRNAFRRFRSGYYGAKGAACALSDNAVEVPPGLDVVTAIPSPAPPRRVSGQVTPASSVRPPSKQWHAFGPATIELPPRIRAAPGGERETCPDAVPHPQREWYPRASGPWPDRPQFPCGARQ